MRFQILALTLLSVAATASAERITHRGDDGVGLTGPLTTVDWRIASELPGKPVEFLIDSFMEHDGYRDAPITCKLAVNGVTQFERIRSKDLPENSLVFYIGPDRATPPFNANITCSAEGVKRQPTTSFAVAVFNNDLANTMDCTLTLDDGDVVAVANEVETQQAGETGLTLQFDTTSADSAEGITASGSFSVDLNAGTATGSLTIDRDTVDDPVIVEVSGSTEADDSGALSRIDVESSDSTISLTCS